MWQANRGPRALLQFWIGTAVVVALLATAFAVSNLASFRSPTAREIGYQALLYFMVFLFGLGAVTWRLQRRMKRDPQARLNASIVFLGIATFFLALLGLSLPLLIRDAAGLF